MPDSVLAQLARFASGVAIEACPEAVVQKARALLLYALGVGAASAAAPELVPVAAALRAEYGDGDAATCLVDGTRMALGAAAYSNAVLCHVRIQDDAHPAGHLGTVIVPAALVVAEVRQRSGRDLLAAIIGGYEIATRIGRDHAVDLSERGFRTTPIYGTLGAAAACARLLGLDERGTLHALALATHGAAGLREFAASGTDEYPLQAGVAARNAITSALLAGEGIAGTESAITGRAGLHRAYGHPDKDYAQRVLAELGTEYEMLRVTYKPYPGGQYHRGVIRGFAALREHARGEAIEAAHVHMHPFEAGYLGLGYKGPFRTYAQAFFSVPFCASLAWLHGTVTFEGLHRFDDPDILALVDRIHVVADQSCERYQPLVRITLKSGSGLQWRDESGEKGYELDWRAAVEMTQALCAEAGVERKHGDNLIEASARADRLETPAALLLAATGFAAATRKMAAIRRGGFET
jgi:2-methylcitrate dehydratase PrpD